jgi:predicted Zn-dependent protease
MIHTTTRLTLGARITLTAVVAGAGLLAGCQGGGSGGGSGEEGARTPANRPIPTVMESGGFAMEARDYDKAVAEFSEVVHRSPGNSQARYMLGKAYLAQGKPAEAREQMEVALAAEVENEDYYDGLCRALYEDGKLDELFRLLRQRTGEHGTVHDYLVLGDYCRRAGDVDEAQNALLTAARLDKGMHVGPQVALADFYDSVNNSAEASRRLRMAYFIDSANPKVNARLEAFGHRLGPGLGLRPLERP